MLQLKEDMSQFLEKDIDITAIKKEVTELKDKIPEPTKEKENLRNEHIKEAGFVPGEKIGQERILAKSDLMGINYLSRGLRAAKAVGRVVIYGQNGKPVEFGTGFMISPNLMITNNHVLPSEEVAASSTFQLDFEVNIYGNLKNFSEYKLLPGEFYHTLPDLDFTIVAVEQTPVNRQQRPLAEFGWLKIYRETGKVVEFEYLTIVQHPNGETKQIAMRENKLIKVLDNSLRYTTDTAPGSSGSCVFNDQWQVVALHNMGVPERSGNLYVTTDGRKITKAEIRDDRELKWIANQGIRISKIIEYLSAKLKNDPHIEELFEQNILMSTQDFNKNMDDLNRKIQEAYRRNANAADATREDTPIISTEHSIIKKREDMQNNKLRVTIPLTIDIGIGGISADNSGGITIAPSAGPVRPAPTAMLSDLETEAIKIDPNYDNRDGYKTKFLNNGSTTVKLPQLSATQKKQVSNLIGTNNETILNYYHYSVVMNKVKRMPFFTAVNVDGSKAVSINRKSQGNDKWFQDPRIPIDHQLHDGVYKNNNLDRGHMVRREDPNWGTQKEALNANSDTFHHTNACPQHANLNQKTWLMLEEYILNYAKKNKERVCIFTGPVFSAQDPVYREGVRLPLQFWKVVVYMKNGKLQSAGYIRSQKEWMDDLEAMKINEQEIKTWQLPLKQIEKLTGLKFEAAVVKADRYKAGGVTLNESMRNANKTAGKVAIEGEGDIDL
jgi:endonuclease G